MAQKKKPMWLRALLALDQMGNVLGGRLLWGPYAGDEDETISSAIGKLKRKGGGAIPWKYPIAKVVDAGLELIDRNHSIDAIENDEGEKA